jgi:hypothetical protein
MLTKNISAMTTNEEYNILRKLAYEDAIKNNKRASISAYIREIILAHIEKNSK